MLNKKGLLVFIILILGMVGSTIPKPEHAETKKRIIFAMSDDVGFEEIGCYGVLDGESITPNIDSLADNGVRFNICYARIFWPFAGYVVYR